MDELNQWIPAAFPALVLAHFFALVSPGPDFFLITGQAIRHRLRGSAFICLGIAVGNGVYIALAIVGWSGVSGNTVLFKIIEGLGCLYLLWMGSMLLKSKADGGGADRGSVVDVKIPQDNPAGKDTRLLSPFKQFAAGLASALLNPKNALFYISLMAVILGRDVTLKQQITAGVWMFSAVLLWDLLIAAIIGHRSVRFYFDTKIYLVERGAGAILIVLALGIVVSMVF